MIAVLTQPDRPAGRGLTLQASNIKEIAIAQKLPILQPKTLRDENIQNELRALHADIMVVVAYGLLLPNAVLSIPKSGCVNIHPSLLPRWRGAAPIQRTIEAGDSETGVAIMQLDAGMDTGPIFMQEKIKLTGKETSQTLHDQLSELGATLLIKTLDALEKNTIHAVAQNNTGVTIAEKIKKEEAKINWSQSANMIAQKIRAFNPWPVAHTLFQNQLLKIWEAEATSKKHSEKPGTLLSLEKNNMVIACEKNSALTIFSVQLPGKKRMPVSDFINGFSTQLKIGKMVFTC